jgi:polyisoprenoid-binding protein YceI
MDSLIDAPVRDEMNASMVAHRRQRQPAMRWPVTASPAWVARAALMTVALALGACQSGTATRPQVSSPPPAAPATGERYVIDARRSEVLVLVYRDGPMASLGHNHVIAVRQLSGLVVVAGELDRSHWQLDFPVDALSVDEPQLRAAQGEEFRTTLGDAAIAGTRAHMLGAALLDAASFPVIHLESEQILPGDDGLRLVVSIVVRDHSARITVPVTLQRTANELVASGEFDLTHAELGLTPYSVAMGALRVADRMRVRYRLVALRDGAASP